jgi:hypothetical protein
VIKRAFGSRIVAVDFELLATVATKSFPCGFALPYRRNEIVAGTGIERQNAHHRIELLVEYK